MTLEELARTHTDTVLAVLVEVAQHGQSEAARVSAANSIIDQGYGKPRQLEPEPALPVANVKYNAEKAAKEHAEIVQFIDEMFLEFKHKEGEQPQSDGSAAVADALPQWTAGWDD